MARLMKQGRYRISQDSRSGTLLQRVAGIDCVYAGNCRCCQSRNQRKNADQSFSFGSSFTTFLPCAKLALRSVSGTFLCTRF